MEDVIQTLQNSVKRMTVLMDQLRTGVIKDQALKTDVNKCISKAIRQHGGLRPIPSLDTQLQSIHVDADPKKLTRVLGHLIQNAQEATPDEGEISIRSGCIDHNAVIDIADTGCGMTAEFIQNHLFKPFDSTKGLTGMGIGVFESREYIRTLGGDIAVKSTPSVGTTFTVTLPAFNPDGESEETD